MGDRGIIVVKGAGAFPEIPVLPNIHAKLLEAVEARPESFDMGTWHNECGTKHCRAGHVVVLAGEAGMKLEAATSTLFAAMQIYHKSSPVTVSPSRFYGSNQDALSDMRRCAKEEANLAGGGA